MGIADPSAMPSSTYVLLSLGLLASICLATDSYAPETEFVQEFRGRWSHDENQLERSAARMFRPDPRSEIGRPEMAAERTRMNVGSRSMVGEGSQATGPRGAKAAAEAAAALYHGRAHKVRVKVGGAMERADKHERKLKDANKRSAEREKKVKKNEKLLKEHAVKRKRRLEKQLKAARADEKKGKREMEIDRKKDAKERRRKMAERAAARERRMKREARMKKEAAHERRLKALARAQGQKRVYNVK